MTIPADDKPAAPKPPVDEKPPYWERVSKLASRIRWCLSCKRYTDDTYVVAPGKPGNGNLCGPGCFKHCEPLDDFGRLPFPKTGEDTGEPSSRSSRFERDRELSQLRRRR